MSGSGTILLIEDEAPIADVVAVALERAGFAVVPCRRLAEGRRRLASGRFDLLVLDLGLPDGDGLELCRELRRGSDLPILILTCRDDEVDRVLGLELGADDYVVKPFSPRELVARVRTILRRTGAAGEASAPLRLGRLEISPQAFRATLDERPVRLTPSELRILRALAESPTVVLSRSALIERALGAGTFVTDRTVDSHVRGIRRKFAALDPDADPVETVFGAGYRIRVLE